MLPITFGISNILKLSEEGFEQKYIKSFKIYNQKKSLIEEQLQNYFHYHS